MSSLTADLRYAIRTLRASPGFAIVAILSLALGIGANTTIFSVTNAVLFSKLRVPEPERLTRIVRGHHSPLDLETLRYVRDHATSFTAVMGERMNALSMTTSDGRIDRLEAAIVTNDFFVGLGLVPAAGRFFSGAGDK